MSKDAFGELFLNEGKSLQGHSPQHVSVLQAQDTGVTHRALQNQHV